MNNAVNLHSVHIDWKTQENNLWREKVPVRHTGVYRLPSQKKHCL